MAEFSLVETNVDCCANCTGIGEECKKGFAWIYCDIRANNDDEFNGDCGELLGCNRFVSAKKEEPEDDRVDEIISE